MGAQVVENGIISLNTPSTDIEAYRRVNLDASGNIGYASIDDLEYGVSNKKFPSSGLGLSDVGAVVTPAATGTVKMTASGAITKYGDVFADTAGKVSGTAGPRYIGRALEAAAADGDIIEVLPMRGAAPEHGPLGLVIESDFHGDWPAAATAMPPWTKTETNGLGVTSVDINNGVLKFAFDAVAEAATATLFFENSPFDIDNKCVFKFRLAVENEGDAAALDIDWGLASDDHATDFESIATFAAFHVDGNTLDLKVHSDDGTTDVAPTDTTVNLTQTTYYDFMIDATTKADVKFWYKATTAVVWTALLDSTTFDISAHTGSITPIVMVEKTSDNTLADVRLDWLRAVGQRTAL